MIGRRPWGRVTKRIRQDRPTRQAQIFGTAARIFCLVFGAGYLLLAVAGITMPGLVASILGHPALTAHELTPDNAVHAVLGAALLVVGLRPPKTVVRTF